MVPAVPRSAPAASSRTRAGFVGTGYELGGPSIQYLLTDHDFHMQNAIDHVSYLGLIQEAVYERLLFEYRNSRDGDGPVVGDIGGDPLRLYGSWNFWGDFMALMNWKHSCQVDYGDSLND
jgi:hypothetical protein